MLALCWMWFAVMEPDNENLYISVVDFSPFIFSASAAVPIRTAILLEGVVAVSQRSRPETG